MLSVIDSIKKNIRSYGYAMAGIKILFKENNFKIHLIATAAVLSLGARLQLTKSHWVVLLISIAIVLASEAFNTAIEKLCDHLHPEKHENIAIVKDIAAAAVLITAIIAAIIGLIIFYQYIP